MGFKRKTHVSRHIQTHTAENPFVCHCGKTFKRVQDYRFHEARHLVDGDLKKPSTSKYKTNIEIIITSFHHNFYYSRFVLQQYETSIKGAHVALMFVSDEPIKRILHMCHHIRVIPIGTLGIWIKMLLIQKL